MSDTRAGRQRRSAGYTLIEVMVAISIVAVGLLGIFEVLHSTLLTNVDARNRAFATRFAQRQLEVVRNTDFSALTTQTSLTDAALAGGLGNAATWDLTVIDVSASLKGVTATVNWAHDGKTQAVSLSTLAQSFGIARIRTQ